MENKKAKITIINLEKAFFKNKEGEEGRAMTKITYCIPDMKTDRFSGHHIMTCYTVEKAFELLDKYIMVPVTAEIEERLTDNGSKYVLALVNDVKLR